MYKKLIICCFSWSLFACSSSTIQDPKGKLVADTSSIQTVGENEITFYNTGKSAVSINDVVLKEDTTQSVEADDDSIVVEKNTCKSGKLYSNQTCKVVLLNQKGKNGTDTITMSTDIGNFNFPIKISTAKGDLDLSNTQITNVGQNKFTITNNRNSNITLNGLVLSTIDTLDTSNDLADCFRVTLKPNDTCAFDIKSFAGEIGADKISVNTNVGDYTYDIAVTTSNNDLVLNSSVIAQAGKNVLTLKNNAINSIKVTSVNFMQDQTFDSADWLDCKDKTLQNNETCNVEITTADKVAGVDTLSFITDVGNYENIIRVDTTGAGILDIDNTATIETTKEQAVHVYNKGTMPIKLTSFDVKQETTLNKMIRAVSLASSDDTLQVNDSTCLNQTIAGGQMCEIKAKAKGNTSIKHIVNFRSTNTYMQEQPIKIDQRTIDTKLGFYATDPSIGVKTIEGNNVILKSPTLQTIYVRNDGTNDMNISSVKLNNNSIGSITTDTCSGKNIYAGEYCQINIQVAENAYGKTELTVTTEQNHPNNTLLFVVNTANLLYDTGASKGTIPLSNTKEFTLVNPNQFRIDIKGMIFDTTTYSVVSDYCQNANLVAGGNCKFTLKANSNIGITKINVVSDAYTPALQLEMQTVNGISILPAVTTNVFKSVFFVDNSASINTVNIAIDNQSGGSIVADGQEPDLFNDSQNCAKFNGSIPVGATCKYILSLPTDPNSTYGNIKFTTSYDGGGSTSYAFAATVNKHIEQVPQLPADGAVLQPTTTINYCDQTVVTGKYSGLSYYGTTFFAIKNNINSFNSGKLPIYMRYFNGNFCGGVDFNITTTPTYSPIQLGYFTIDGYDDPLVYFQDGGTNCGNDSSTPTCTINLYLQIGSFTLAGFNWTTLTKWVVQFDRPKPASSNTVVDSIVWK